ncbi:MAG TPA: diacylglycerol kinase family protein [Actinomycetota bacterium]|nr:diacylglycerol kinase family protein [Actinomycetota bacterium]
MNAAGAAARPETGHAAPPVLLVNPEAGRLHPEARDRVVAKVRSSLGAEVVTTGARDEAMHLAAEAAASGSSFVVAFGGDGHVNEVANGLAGTPSSLALLPGGTMNRFARTLGVPRDPLAAVDHLVAAVSRPPRRVNLGQMDGRYFTVSAGCGFDAETAELVDRDLRGKRRFGELFFYWSAFRVLAGAYRHRKPNLIVRGAFGEIAAAMVIVSNAGPYAYLLGRPVVLAPKVQIDEGLDLLALRSMKIEALPIYIWRTAISNDFAEHRDAFYVANLRDLEVEAPAPFHRHVDGEPLPPATSSRFSMAEGALGIVV